MTTATDILTGANSASAADTAAQTLTDAIDQDWEHEATLYTFDDESVLVISGPQVNAYPDMGSATAALRKIVTPE